MTTTPRSTAAAATLALALCLVALGQLFLVVWGVGTSPLLLPMRNEDSQQAPNLMEEVTMIPLNQTLSAPLRRNSTEIQKPEASSIPSSLIQPLLKEGPIPVYLWPNVNETVHEMRHFTLEGIDQSPLFQRLYSIHDLHKHPHFLWMADVSQGAGPRKWCATLLEAIREALALVPPSFKFRIYIFDWSDSPGWPSHHFHCPSLRKQVGASNIVLLKRSVVVNRHWNATTSSVEVGHLLEELVRNYSHWSAAPVRHVGYGVRTDLVNMLTSLVHPTLHPALSLVKPPHNTTVTGVEWVDYLERPQQVAHYWPCGGGGVDRGGKVSNSQLRDTVSCRLQEWCLAKNTSVQVGLAGRANLEGRKEVSQEYALSLLQHEIVVVAQKDNWEDHYRLLEALVSGALVFTDFMWTLPEGLKDKHNIVVYRNVSDLVQQLEYYLWGVPLVQRRQMAVRGRRVAMDRHRSWHVMERALLGRRPSVE